MPGREAELGGQPLVVFKVAQTTAGTELPGGGPPDDAGAIGHVPRIVGSRGAELADVGIHGGRIPEALERTPGDKEAGREASAEEVLGHLPVAGAPERPGALH